MTTPIPQNNKTNSDQQGPIVEPKPIPEKLIGKFKGTKIDPIYVEYAETRDVKLRNKIVEQNEALVTYTLNKYYANRLDGDPNRRREMYQEGVMGLMSAVEGYRPDYGYQFSTYALWWVKQAMNNYLINLEPLIHVPAHIRAANTKALKQMTLENKQFGELLQIYKEANYSDKLIRSIQASLNTKMVVSLAEPAHRKELGETDGLSWEDAICSRDDEDETNQETKAEASRFGGCIRSAFSRLDNKDKFILLLRFDAIDKIPEKFHVKPKKRQNHKGNNTNG